MSSSNLVCTICTQLTSDIFTAPWSRQASLLITFLNFRSLHTRDRNKPSASATYSAQWGSDSFQSVDERLRTERDIRRNDEEREQKYVDEKDIETDDAWNVESDDLTIDEFLKIGGNRGFLNFLHFSYDEFKTIYDLLSERIETYISRRREPELSESRMDLLFMLMVTMILGSTWVITGQIFRMKSNKSEMK